MPEKKIKVKDMMIAIFCTLLAILCIVFYFLPAFSVKHSTGPQNDYEVVNFSAWEMTKAAFGGSSIEFGSTMHYLMGIKQTYGFAVITAGILMPLAIASAITTAVFSFLSWLKNEDFKKFCFLFSLCGMMFQTLSLITTWFIAIQLKDGNNMGVFNLNLKGNISYASFVSLILAFVIAIIACAYNYFLDNFDEEDEEDDDDEEEVVIVRRKKKFVYVDENEEEEEKELPKKKQTVNKFAETSSKTASTGGKKFVKVSDVESNKTTSKAPTKTTKK